jgi:predicted aconitase with swiveling domain/ADP-ribose pyrophosphatase YjhB (NUDIX family)
MRMDGRSIYRGRAEGKVLKLDEPLSFLGGVDAASGELKVAGGGNVAGKVLVFPRGKGSTVGSFVMYDLMVHGKAPLAVVNSSAETIVATGAVISSIPMVDKVDVGLIHEGDNIIVDGDAGTVDLPDVRVIECASSAVIIDRKLMILHRPATARSYPDRWSLCSGKIESGETPEQAAIREIKEETQMSVSVPDRVLPAVMVREGVTIWKVYPFLFHADGQTPVLNRENTEYRLIDPKELSSYRTVDLTVDVLDGLLN